MGAKGRKAAVELRNLVIPWCSFLSNQQRKVKGMRVTFVLIRDATTGRWRAPVLLQTAAELVPCRLSVGETVASAQPR